MNSPEHQKQQIALHTQRGVTFIMAATVYWLAIGISGLYLSPKASFTLSIWTTGILFPLSVLLAKVLSLQTVA